MTEIHPNLLAVSDADFDQQVLQSPLPVLMEFTAEWCPPCRILAPHFERLSGVYEGRLKFAKLDTDENLGTQARYGVQGIPTFILFAGGKPVGRVVGPQPGRFQQVIDQMLADADVETASV